MRACSLTVMLPAAISLAIFGLSHSAKALELGQCWPTASAYQQALTDENQVNLVVTNQFVHDADNYQSGHFEGRLFTGGADGRGYIVSLNYPIGEVPYEGSKLPPASEKKICVAAKTEHLSLLDARLHIVEEATDVVADAEAVKAQCAEEKRRDQLSICSDHNAAIKRFASMGFYTFIQGRVTEGNELAGIKAGNGFSLTAAYKGDPNGELGQITPQGTRIAIAPVYNTDYMPKGLAILDDVKHRRDNKTR